MAARSKGRKVPPKWRNRIVGYGETTAAELAANPRNPRIHTTSQRGALTAILDDVGFVAPIIVNQLSGLIVDGHMRVEETPDGPIPVAYVELTDAEEAEVLALMDPIGAMAGHDIDKLAELTDGLTLSSDLSAVLDDLLPDPATPPAPPLDIPLRPLQRVHVLISVPLDKWDQVGKLLDEIADVDTVEVHQTIK